MNYIYDRTFKIGVVIGVVIYLLANVVNYLLARKKYESDALGSINFAPVARFRWGFPFNWDGENFGFFWDGALNVMVAAVFAIVFAIFFKFAVSKPQSRRHK